MHDLRRTRALPATLLYLAAVALTGCNTNNFSGTKAAVGNAAGSSSDATPLATAPVQPFTTSKLVEPTTALDSSTADSCSAVLSTSGYRDPQRNMVFRQLPKTEDYCGALDACAAMDPQGQFLTIGDEVTDAMKNCLHMAAYWAYLPGETKEPWKRKYCGSQLSLYNIPAATTKEKARAVICTYPYRAP